MKVVPLYCPHCSAPVGKDAKFCSQCGSPIVIDDGVNRSEHTYRTIDAARIREAEAAAEKERQKTERAKAWFRIYPVLAIIMFLGMFLMEIIMGLLNQ